MLPLNPAQIPAIFKQALQLQNAGKLDEAEAKYRMIEGVRPDLPEVLFQRGRIALARGKADAAETLLAKAAKAKPQEPAIWLARAEALAALEDEARNKAALKQAKAARLDPKLLIRLQDRLKPARMRSKTGIGDARPEDIQALIALMGKGQIARAEAAAQALRKRHPDVAIIADILATAQIQLGKLDAAEANFRAAIALDPAYAEVRNNYGRFLVEQGRVDEGIEQIRAALERAPKMPLAYQNLGIALAERGDVDGAIKAFRRAVSIEPNLLESHGKLGEMLSRARDYDAAVTEFRAAIKLGDTRRDTRTSLAQALSAAGQEDEALAMLDDLLARESDFARGHGARAVILQSLGRFDEADAAFRRSLALNPEDGEAYRLFVATRKLAADDPLIAEMQKNFDNETLAEDTRMHLGFALAKAMEDSKQYDRVFAYLNPANALMRKRFPYDIEARRVDLEKLRAACDGTDFTTRKVAGTSDFAPIFVTGMPRSGTTLVEQILASHSRVTGAGEVGRFVTEALAGMQAGGGELVDVAEMEDAAIAGIGQRVADWFGQHFPQADLITDKSIQSYVMTGLIHLALPNAKVIIVRRDPRDTALSIYKNVFPSGTHGYGYDLRDLGLYYRLFDEMVAYWREKLPGGFYEVEYEALIADPETQARALVAAAGLDWEDQCLNFHENQRRVQTLSLYQVRQPIYTSSMKAWQRYEAELQPLIEALGDAVDGGEDGA